MHGTYKVHFVMIVGVDDFIHAGNAAYLNLHIRSHSFHLGSGDKYHYHSYISILASTITMSIHCCNPFKAAASASDIDAAISSQHAACAPSTGSSRRAIVVIKCCRTKVMIK